MARRSQVSPKVATNGVAVDWHKGGQVGWENRASGCRARARWAVLAMLGSLLLVAGCEAEEAASAAKPDSQASSDAADAADSLDALSTACPGGIGCACASDAECPAASKCAPVSETERRCAAPCGAGKICSQTGLVCRTISKEGASLDLCITPLTLGCQPCGADADCNTGVETLARCAGIADGSGAAGYFCTDACSNDSGCPEGYSCDFASLSSGSTARVCRPKTDTCACSPQSIAASKATACRIASCLGSRQCSADGLTECAVTIETETCNGVDDDCDGATDEDPLALCNDSEPCTQDSCGGAKGCDFLALDGPCDDGSACTTDDTCQVSACLGKPLLCDDNNACTADSCNPQTGCVHTAQTGNCEDGDACTSNDFCTGTTCTSGGPTDCDDGEVCTADSCDKTNGCANLPADVTCTDNNVCTEGDACEAGSCTASPISCDDGDGCTLDACDPVGGCSHTPDGDALCQPLSLPLSLPLDCASASWKPWKVAKTGSAFGWAFATASPLPEVSDACALHAAVPSACKPGAWQASATLGPLAVPTLPTGGKIALQLESGGLISGVTLKAQGSINGTTWSTLGSIPATSTQWGKATFPFNAVAGASAAKQVYVRLLLEGSACPGPDDTGWFIRNVAVFQDLCGVSNGGCDAKAKCTAEPDGTTSCVCNKGYEGSGQSCADIDECATQTDNCQGVAECNNSVGSFSCSCPSGYQAASPTTCVDINECDTGAKVCGAKEMCVNQVPGATCVCAPGYTGEPGACTDVNECAEGTAKCSVNGKCTNTIGNYMCSCKPGYTGDGKTCEDEDECKTGNNQCSVNANCFNLVGSYSCVCKTGYSGDGFSCKLN